MPDNEMQGEQGKHESQWERELLSRLSFATLAEQRRARRWNIFFKLVLFSYLFLLLFLALRGPDLGEARLGDHTAMVEVNGMISDATPANADTIIKGLRKAFRNENTKGVVLRINSPGGSPVQAGYVNDEIYRLREKYPDTRVYAVVTDICASGGYYIAAAADEIYADKASMVGSIGVLMDGYGFTGAMEKLGVERRLYTAGENKGFLDPFSPEKKEDVKHIKMMLNNIHQQFINVVKKGRGDKLTDDPKLFSGLIWTGEESLDLGLIDGLGSSGYVAREIIKAEKIVDYTLRPSFFERFAGQFGAAMANSVSETFGLEGGSIK